MSEDLEISAFLERNRIAVEIWKTSGMNWKVLMAIGADYNEQRESLKESAELFARVIQKFDAVHSVRWRVKDTEHLLEKIIRKKSEKNPKYDDISTENYYEKVSDLVGIRALHLFKDDCLLIDLSLRKVWALAEPAIAYIRRGDTEETTTAFAARHLEVKQHPAGYRSVHYVVTSQPTQRKLLAEIQVRTIFEEGWSEIDHRVRYPNFSDDQLVGYFLNIFNRLAGSADEMGGFVKGLATTLRDFEQQVACAKAEKDNALAAMEKSVGELERLKQQDAQAKSSIAQLKSELEKLKRATGLESFVSRERSINALAAIASGSDNKYMARILADTEAQERRANEVLSAIGLPENALARLAKGVPK